MPRAHLDGEPLTDEEFILFLTDTLIPDLRSSGWDATAEDFERLIDICLTEERWLELKHQGLVKE